MKNGIDETNSFYGSIKGVAATSRLLMPNGSVDPWHKLGLIGTNQNQEASAFPIFIKGTAHCADMYPATVLDPTSLKNARTTIQQFIDKWLSSSRKRHTRKSENRLP